MVVVLVALALGAAFPAAPLAAPGDLDRRFGDNGKVRTTLGSGSDWASDVAVQANGRIVVVGSTEGRGGRFAVVRYNPGGRLDRTFSGDGVARVNFAADDWATDVAIQPDGKIVVVGTTYTLRGSFALARLNPNGTLDTTFGDNGKVMTDFGPYDPTDVHSAYARGVVIQPDGKIVVAGGSEFEFECGSEDFALARYNPDGTLDSNFGDAGLVTTNVSDLEEFGDGAVDVAMQEDGKIVAVGHASDCGGTIDFGLARYNVDGTLDSTFGGGDGKLTTGFVGDSPPGALAIQEDGKIVAAGKTGSKGGRFALIRYETDGDLDTTFGGDGRTAKDFTASRDRATDVVIQASGRILAVGVAGRGDARFAMARFDPDGTCDSSFGSRCGGVMTNFTARGDFAEAVAIQSPTRLVAAGVGDASLRHDSWIALARYQVD